MWTGPQQHALQKENDIVNVAEQWYAKFHRKASSKAPGFTIDYGQTGFDTEEGVKELVSSVNGFFINYTVYSNFTEQHSTESSSIKWSIIQRFELAERGLVGVRLDIAQAGGLWEGLSDADKQSLFLTGTFNHLIHLVLLALSVTSFYLNTMHYFKMADVFQSIHKKYQDANSPKDHYDTDISGSTLEPGEEAHDEAFMGRLRTTLTQG